MKVRRHAERIAKSKTALTGKCPRCPFLRDGVDIAPVCVQLSSTLGRVNTLRYQVIRLRAKFELPQVVGALAPVAQAMGLAQIR